MSQNELVARHAHVPSHEGKDLNIVDPADGPSQVQNSSPNVLNDVTDAPPTTIVRIDDTTHEHETRTSSQCRVSRAAALPASNM